MSELITILNDATDEEIEKALQLLNPSGKTAGEEVDEALEQFIKLGVMPEESKS